MQTILSEFKGSMERIKNNFVLSFLTINFINQRPFNNDVVLPIEEFSHKFITARALNSFDVDGIQEYANSIRRHFLNDIVIVYERYSMLMFVSHKNNRCRIEPCFISDSNVGAHNFEQVSKVYSQDDMTFLIQLRRLRNCIVHFNGMYSSTNVLDYVFGTQKYESKRNEGNKISIEFDNILWIYDKLMNIIECGNDSYFKNYSINKISA
ncbi:MAG: hypothetical protein ABIH85_04860 [Candidatus Omnitrophota bacterium]|nr:hypothetical protein [Candidatus Omnitrophota bacterium]